MNGSVESTSNMSLWILCARIYSCSTQLKTVDQSIDAMSSLMVGCEQISENMAPVEKLMEQLKAVKDTLTILEEAVDAADQPLP